jgi:protein-S-isoprenylcysteine O-methyltransferase Ste14
MPPSSSSDESPRERGGRWVLAQALLTVLIVVLVFLPPFWPTELSFAGIPIALAGAIGFVWATRTLGKSLTPYPRPRASGELVLRGPYRLVRHPIYASGFLFFLGVGLSSSVPATLATLALGVLWWRKAAVEETHLLERFPEYEDYRSRVRI